MILNSSDVVIYTHVYICIYIYDLKDLRKRWENHRILHSESDQRRSVSIGQVVAAAGTQISFTDTQITDYLVGG